MSDLEAAVSFLSVAEHTLSQLAEDLARGTTIERSQLRDARASIRRAEREIFGPPSKSKSGDGARKRILEYLKANVGRDIPGEAIGEVAGIQEWARRIRELRVEFGYEITELGNSLYRLESVEPDLERANLWKTANRIRRQGGSAIGRIEDYLIENEGAVVTREQIDYVAKIKEGSRRIRELRDEYGWPINSHVDERGLQPGEYRLVSAAVEDRRDIMQRIYPEDLRHEVFSRDQFTCQECKRNREAADASGDTRFYLEVHHIAAVADELSDLPTEELNSIENLITLCHSCHLKKTADLQKRKRESRNKN